MVSPGGRAGSCRCVESWRRTRLRGLGRELVQEIRRVSAFLCDLPHAGEPLDSRHRRFPLRKFPFGLIYRVDDDLLRIVAVAHRRQRPGYWRGRN
jgi:toxin ParE1/3/4